MLALLLGLAPDAAAQSATASVSSAQVRVGETLTYTVVLDGGRGRRVGPPLATGGLRLVSRQPILDVTTTINGRTERRVGWAYQATRPGTGRIGQFRAEVGGRPVVVDAVTVSVRSGPPASVAPAPAPSGGRELFVRAEPSRQTAVVGQQVVVDYVLYFEPQIQPRQTAPIGTWDAAGAWREELEIASAYPRPTTLGGQPYEAVTIRRVALFPTRSGTLELAPMQFTIDLMRTDRSFSNDPFAPFFSPFSQRFEDREVTAPAVTVDVRPLPDGAPPSFAGAVGQFELSTTVDQRAVGPGDAVRIRVAVRGDGNVATVEAPVLDVPPGVDAYDAREDRELLRTGPAFRGIKTFTYTLVPQGGGTFDVPAAPWTYFDPTDGRYKTLRTDPVTITADGPALADEAPTDGPGAPAALITAADWRRPAGRPTWLWAVLGGGLALPAVAASLFLAARVGRERLAADTPAKRRRRTSADVRQRLQAARTLDGAPAFAEVERAVRTVLADRFGVPPTASADAVGHALAQVPDALRQQTRAVLDAAARGQFAPGLGGSPSALADEAEALLEAFDRLPHPGGGTGRSSAPRRRRLAAAR
ncbi:BatD family protein [Rubrivirga sp.]|uniref:BatD family protein n=1 Tax=Rubrivirga sp. TaxID=1885344 RepID=UPI003B52FF7E